MTPGRRSVRLGRRPLGLLAAAALGAATLVAHPVAAQAAQAAQATQAAQPAAATRAAPTAPAANLHDNAFSSAVADASLTTSPTIRYANNFYGGAPLPVPATDTTARTGDPLMVNPAVSGPYGTADSGPRLRTALGFAPRPGSPLIGNGTVVPDNGGRDYRGTPLYRGRPDIGAVEGPPGGARAGHGRA
ncbi:hypothetical protein ACWGLG_26010 [Streptomyces antimycoticus]